MRSWLPGLGCGQGSVGQGRKRTFWGDGAVVYFGGRMGLTGSASAKTYQMIHMRFMYFTICKFYLNKGHPKQIWNQRS